MPLVVLAERHLALVRRLAAEAGVDEAQVRLFGSRVTGRPRRFSDVDLALQGVGERIASDFAERLDDSELPYRVDVVVLETAADALRESALRTGVPLRSARSTEAPPA